MDILSFLTMPIKIDPIPFFLSLSLQTLLLDIFFQDNRETFNKIFFQIHHSQGFKFLIFTSVDNSLLGDG